MMFNANLVLLAATALGSLAAANPAPMAMGVEVLEQNGSLMVREVVCFLPLLFSSWHSP